MSITYQPKKRREKEFTVLGRAKNQKQEGKY